MNKSIFQFFRKFELDKLVLLACILIYFIIGILLVQNYLYVFTTDTISYIHVAQHYINGIFPQAINGYWSPLFSWLLIPFLTIWPGKLGALYSIKILNLIIGCFTFFSLYLLEDKLKFDIRIKTVTFVILIPITLYFAYSNSVPDLLVLTLLLFYINFLLDNRYLHNLQMGVLTGFFGALAFLSKSYAFFFFIVHFMVVNIDYWLKFKENRKIITKNFILGLMIFLAISGIWVALISDKYDKLTIGTAGTYNHDIFGPRSQGDPVYYDGLLKPYDEYATSAWDDPSYIKVKGWSPFSSINNFNFQLAFIVYNTFEIFKIIEKFSILSILIIILALFLIFKSNNKLKNKLTLLTLTVFIYLAGYSLLIVEIRYLWFVDVLLLIMGILCVKILSEDYSIRKSLSMILVFLICWSFVFFPILSLYDVSGDGKDIYVLAQDLKKQGIEGNNMASRTDLGHTLILAYYLDAKYYGLTRLYSGNETSEVLFNNNIKYYFSMQKDRIEIPGYKIIDTGYNNPLVYQPG